MVGLELHDPHAVVGVGTAQMALPVKRPGTLNQGRSTMTGRPVRPLKSFWPKGLLVPVLAACVWCAVVAPVTVLAQAPATRPFGRPTTRDVVPSPKTAADLRAIERQVEAVVKKVTPATVGLTIGPAQGSGVIVSKDGYVLTAAHVAREPGARVQVILSDGRRVRGKSL